MNKTTMNKNTMNKLIQLQGILLELKKMILKKNKKPF